MNIDETLNVLRLGIGPTLLKSLSTTNPIESTFSTVRRVSRRVTRWQSGPIVLRWAQGAPPRPRRRGDG